MTGQELTWMWIAVIGISVLSGTGFLGYHAKKAFRDWTEGK